MGRTILLALMFVAAGAEIAYGGQITGRPTQYFCQVKVIECNLADLDKCPLRRNGPMRPGGPGEEGAIGSLTGHLCYKRSNNPPDCGSGLMANWQCFTNTISRPNDVEIR